MTWRTAADDREAGMIEKEVRVVMKVEQVEQIGWVTEATEAATTSTEAKKR